MRGSGYPELIILLCLATGAACVRFMAISNNDKSGLTGLMDRLTGVRHQLECLVQCRVDATTARQSALCVYRRCTSHSPPRAADGLRRLPNGAAGNSRTPSSSSAASAASGSASVRGGRRNAASGSTERAKRWQYADPLQVCTNRHCQGLELVQFYQCVFRKCIAEEEEEEER